MSRKITLRKSDGLDDWFCIEWAEHDNRSWMEPSRYGGMSFRHSGRVSDCDIEGTSAEMLAIAEAIERGDSASFKRCSAEAVDGAYEIMSPRNDTHPAVITVKQAQDLAIEIRRVLESAKTPNAVDPVLTDSVEPSTRD